MPVGMTYQVADVTKPLNPVSKMCDAGNIVTSTAEGVTQEFVDGRFDALQTWVWSVCVEHLGNKWSARRNGFCQAGKVISRASRAASPILGQVSDEEDVLAIEESTSDDEEQDHCVFHGIDDESEIEREVRRSKCNNISACISRTGAGANTVCLVAESAPNIDEEILVKFQ